MNAAEAALDFRSVPGEDGPPYPAGVRVILASQSPRRRMLLEQRGIAHDAIHPGIDDALLEPGEQTHPAHWAAALAYLKARAGAQRLAQTNPGGTGIIIGADTVVVKGDELIGQPRDAADAERIIRTLQNGEHLVITGVALVSVAPSGEVAQSREDREDSGRNGPRRWPIIFTDRANVRVGDLGDARIAEYIASGTWRGKAGAYNLSERLEAGWPIDYDGDAGTIMGLPVDRLMAILQNVGHTL